MLGFNQGNEPMFPIASWEPERIVDALAVTIEVRGPAGGYQLALTGIWGSRWPAGATASASPSSRFGQLNGANNNAPQP